MYRFSEYYTYVKYQRDLAYFFYVKTKLKKNLEVINKQNLTLSIYMILFTIHIHIYKYYNMIICIRLRIFSFYKFMNKILTILNIQIFLRFTRAPFYVVFYRVYLT